ncbi:unnamed protein product [Clavelina lepadiformis]|uniref:alpha-L-fucosidase n=1 Tax=Clavelina lepadiformis TaxID=159417 RepID=A0ABP0FH66_CLALP
MARLWYRRLRVAFYAAVILVLLQVLRYSFSRDAEEKEVARLKLMDAYAVVRDGKHDVEKTFEKNYLEEVKELEDRSEKLIIDNYDSRGKNQALPWVDEQQVELENQDKKGEDHYEDMINEQPGAEDESWSYNDEEPAPPSLSFSKDINESEAIVEEDELTHEDQFGGEEDEETFVEIDKPLDLEEIESQESDVEVLDESSKTAQEQALNIREDQKGSLPFLEQNNQTLHTFSNKISKDILITSNGSDIIKDSSQVTPKLTVASNVLLTESSKVNELTLQTTKKEPGIHTGDTEVLQKTNTSGSNKRITLAADVRKDTSLQPKTLPQSIEPSPSQNVYSPTWESLDKRPLPQWYDDAKFGIFIHWGLYSVPGFASEKFWWKWKGPEPDATVTNHVKKNYPASFQYSNFTKDFTAEFFDADKWVNLFEASGAKYVVLTSKHHDGYTMWPSTASKAWNSMESGPHRDIVGELSEAVRKSDMKFGVYYSLFEWFNSLYLKDARSNFTSWDYVKHKSIPELFDLAHTYKPDIVWSDGDKGPDTYWKSTTFLAWLYNESEMKDTVVTNDRWGAGTNCKHGGFLLCPDYAGKRKWESVASIDRVSWGGRRNVLIEELMTIDEIIQTLVSSVSRGGNFLLNIGPSKDGTIPSIFQERLHMVGMWLQTNGEAIYSTRPWRTFNDTLTSGVWYSYKDGTIYAFISSQPENDTLLLGAPVANSRSRVTLLGWESDSLLTWSILNVGEGSGVKIMVPNECWLIRQCKWVVTLKLDNFD